MRGWRVLPPLAAMSLALASCSGGVAGQGSAPARASALASPPASAPPRSLSPAGSGSPATVVPGRPLPAPAALVPFSAGAAGGAWHPAGRAVTENGQSLRAVYETTLVPPGGTRRPGSRGWIPACWRPGCTPAR